MTKLQLDLKRKEKRNANNANNVNIFSVGLNAKVVSMDREIENNKAIFSRDVEKMTDADRLAAYERKYNEDLLPERREADAADRETRKLRKRARSMAKNSNKRYSKLRKKVKDLAGSYAHTAGVDDFDFTVDIIKKFRVPASYSEQDKKAVYALKKNAKGCYQRYLNMKKLYEDMNNNDDEHIEFFNVVVNEYEIAYGEWAHMKELAETLCSVNIRKFTEEEKKKLAAKNKRNDASSRMTYQDGDFKDAFAEQIEKKTTDWNADFDKEIKKLEEEKATSEEKIDVIDYDVEINTLKVKKFLKNEMDKIIKEKKEQENIELTYEEIEGEVNTYLKKVVENAELRFRCDITAAMGILGSRMYSTTYKELVNKYYSSKVSEKYDNLRYLFNFGYAGGKDATEYQGYSFDDLKYYGNISVKLNKKKHKDYTGFIVGNSYSNYEVVKTRAITDPDILAVGKNLWNVYDRAIKVKNGEKLLSAEQEANEIGMYQFKSYLECHFSKRIDAENIDEITLMYTDRKLPKDKAGIIETISNDKSYRELYNYVKYINENPESFGRREDDPPIKITIWTNDKRTIDFDGVKYIFETTKAKSYF